jgi:hypothetical protein
MNKIKCRYCKNEATHNRVFDIDLPKIPLCDERACFIKLYIKINS